MTEYFGECPVCGEIMEDEPCPGCDGVGDDDCLECGGFGDVPCCPNVDCDGYEWTRPNVQP